MIDLTKFDTKTRDGTQVRNLYFTDITKAWPIQGERLSKEGIWFRTMWDIKGRFDTTQHGLDLIIRKKKKQLSWTKELPTKEGWYWHVYKHGSKYRLSPTIVEVLYPSYVADSEIRVRLYDGDEIKVKHIAPSFWLSPLEAPTTPETE